MPDRKRVSYLALLAAACTFCTSVVTGANHEALQIFAWGLDNYGETIPPGGSDIAAIAAGGGHGLALRQDGSLVGWGFDHQGQASPPEGNDFVAIACGGSHSLALNSDGSITAWGLDNHGQVSGTPTDSDFVEVAAGVGNSLARRADGSIVAWGRDDSFYSGQVSEVPEGTGFKAISTAHFHSLALAADGSIVAWGNDNLGRTDAPAGTGFVAISAGHSHSLALRFDGSIVAWGGLPDDPAVVDTPDGNDFVAIAAGFGASMAVRSDGTIVGWGSDTGGQLTLPRIRGFKAITFGKGYLALALGEGAGAIFEWGWSHSSSVPPDGRDFIAVSAGGAHNLALRKDGSIVGWGYNEYGAASAPEGFDYLAVSAGELHSLALRRDGSLVGWGGNDHGQANPPEDGEFTAVSAGGDHSLALRKDGSIAAWGRDDQGQASPPAGNDFVAISAGSHHSLALREDGTIAAWGRNDEGQADPPTSAGFTAIAAGGYHSLALKTDGSIQGWGANGFGEATPPIGNFVAIDAGSSFGLALNISGIISAAWGNEFAGQLSAPGGFGFLAIDAGRERGLAIRPVTEFATPKIVSPKTGAVFATYDFVTIEVELEGSIVDLDHVAFYRDSLRLFEATEPPFRFTIEMPKAGVYSIQTVAVFKDGPSHPSEPVFFVVGNCAIDFIKDFVDQINNPGAARDKRGLVDTFASEILDLDLELLRQFRDEVLHETPSGRYYTDLYERVSGQLFLTLLQDPFLVLRAHEALVEWSPAIQALVDGQGSTTALTPEMIAAAEGVLDDLGEIATGDLAEVIDTETTALDPNTWSGMSIGDLLERVETQERPPPTINTHPVMQSVEAGASATLSVEADGAGPFTYQWFKDGSAIAGATDATYALSSAQAFHGGDYSVMVANPFGETTSDSASLAVSAPPPSDARLLNLSTRAQTLTGDDVLIPGFVIDGTASKRILARVVGPTLADFGVAGALADPVMTLKQRVGASSVDLAINDDWGANANAAEIVTTSALAGAFALNEASKDSALLLDLQPGQYTIVAEGKDAGTGVAIVELYDVDGDGSGSRLINISTRGFVGEGDLAMIPGFVISEEGPRTVLVRAVGPTLASLGVTGTMADPKLTVVRNNPDGSSTELFSQDNWGDSSDAANTEATAALVGAFALDPDSADAAFVLTLAPGVYSIIGASADGTGTGIVLTEVYVVP